MSTKLEALKTLDKYCREMRTWELACAKREHSCDEGQMEYAESERVGMGEYRAIFVKYCSATAKPRNYVFTEPPQHDPDNHIIENVEESPDRIRVQLSFEAGPMFRFLYELIFEDAQWKLQSRKHVGHDGQKIEAEL